MAPTAVQPPGWLKNMFSVGKEFAWPVSALSSNKWPIIIYWIVFDTAKLLKPIIDGIESSVNVLKTGPSLRDLIFFYVSSSSTSFFSTFSDYFISPISSSSSLLGSSISYTYVAITHVSSFNSLNEFSLLTLFSTLVFVNVYEVIIN